MEGRTIAVDPDVIPLGWWVYIEGIGFRRAEDTEARLTAERSMCIMKVNPTSSSSAKSAATRYTC